MEKRGHQIPLKLSLLITAVIACRAEWCGGKPGSGDGGPCRVDGPRSSSDQPKWLAALRADRDALGISASLGSNTALDWTRTAFVQPQMHPFDLTFYDHVKHNFTPDRYLDDLEARYGGVDAIVLWPTYPTLGIDDRCVRTKMDTQTF